MKSPSCNHLRAQIPLQLTEWLPQRTRCIDGLDNVVAVAAGNLATEFTLMVSKSSDSQQYEEDQRELEKMAPLLAGGGVEEPPAKKAKKSQTQ